jgi:hypothetical protein
MLLSQSGFTHRSTIMNIKHTIIAGFLAASAGFFGLAYAQGPGCNIDGPMGGMMQRGMRNMDPAQMAERHLTQLKSQLKITAQQEALWQAYAESSKTTMGKGMKPMPPERADEKLSAPERMAKMQESMKARLASMDEHHQSFKRLYDALTPEQKAAADQHFSRIGQSMGGKGGPRGGKGPGNGPAAPQK